MKTKPRDVARLSKELIRKRYRQKKGVFVLYIILNAVVIASIVSAAIQAHWESVFIGFLAMMLLLIPTAVERSLKVKLPTALETVALLFIFAAQILGEMNDFYVHIPWWDDLLHTVNGFMFAAFGFALVDILNRSERSKFNLSPVFLAMVAFCFSMTIGVLWEFFEYFADGILRVDMQKDSIVTAIRSMELSDPAHPTIIRLTEISKTVVNYGEGQQYVIEGGYLDIGLHDTILDLIVNFIGAFVFSVFGFIYVKGTGRHSKKIAEQFIPKFAAEDGAEKVPAEEVPEDTPTEDTPTEDTPAEIPAGVTEK
ncbi:MAG: hypothetical protein IJW71_01045 [Clostridia bacterium]|nr:hypothetical protein [Clostridia bacterium]